MNVIELRTDGTMRERQVEGPEAGGGTEVRWRVG